MPETLELPIRIAFSVLALAVIGWNLFSMWRGRKSKAAFFSLILLAALSVGLYFNFGKFHGQSFIHHWEFFHYFLNSKYFPELGYDGLYSASIKAQTETDPRYPRQRATRDLRTNQKMFVSALTAHQEEVKARFSPERWKDFSKDNSFFLRWNTPGYIEKVRSDHGFNASPTWIFVARLFDNGVSAKFRPLSLLASLDIVLLAIMFVVVFRTYGATIGLISLIVFCLNYAGRFDWLGGALLRQDWLAAAVMGVCMLRRRRHAAAGLLFAYATMVRIFPVLFLLGPGVLALKSLLQERRLPKWAWQLGLGYLVGLMICFGAGCLTGKGMSAWTEFAGKIEQHHATWLTNNVGLHNVLLYGPDTFSRRTVSWNLLDPWTRWQAKMTAMKHDRRILLTLAVLLYVGVISAAAWRCSLDEAAALGMGAIYATLLLTCYYWAMLLMLPFKRRSEAAVVAFFGFNIFLCIVHLAHGSFELRYGLMSWTLGALLLVWALPDALRTFRGVPEETDRQSHGPPPDAGGDGATTGRSPWQPTQQYQ